MPAADDVAQAFTKTWHRGSRAVDTRSPHPLLSLSYTHAHTGDVFGDLVRDALSGQALAKVVHKIALGCAGKRAG